MTTGTPEAAGVQNLESLSVADDEAAALSKIRLTVTTITTTNVMTVMIVMTGANSTSEKKQTTTAATAEAAEAAGTTVNVTVTRQQHEAGSRLSST